MAFGSVLRWRGNSWIRPVSAGLLLFLVYAGAAFQSPQATLHAQTRVQGGIVHPTLLQQLNAGLFARTPDERAFNKKVVQLVQEGKLPISLVQSTFMWARNKQPYPMVYFEFALRLRAKRAGIAL